MYTVVKCYNSYKVIVKLFPWQSFGPKVFQLLKQPFFRYVLSLYLLPKNIDSMSVGGESSSAFQLYYS